jgi:protein-L-isoaspartate(D-aspartate) O-methyltransferase
MNMFAYIKHYLFNILISGAIIFPALEACTQDTYQEQREKMVRYQIEERGVQDSDVLNAMRKVERHFFVPVDVKSYAYEDRPLPIGYGQTISQPYIVAYMTEILDLHKNEKVLEIGTGSGYQAAILAEICDSVYSIEVVPELGTRAINTLNFLGYKGVKVKIGDGYQGWDKYAPFEAIIVTCAPTHVPKKLTEQLSEGGRMIIPVGERYVQELVLLEKKNGKLREKKVLPVLFVPMVDQYGKPY